MNPLAVITGATKGIGRAVANRFAQSGFDVAVCSRHLQELEKMKQEVEKAHRVSVFIKQADVANKEQAEGFCKMINELDRPVDALINNAGRFVAGEIMHEPNGTLEDMIETNVYSAYYVTRGLVDGMKKKQAGHIFNLCSIASIKAYPNGGSYSISKFALLGFSKVLREELKPHHIGVTAILPGATKTDSWNGVDLPDSRFMRAEDVAEVIFNAYSISEHSVVEEIIMRPVLGDI